jgi:mono/diheme cytochrome c family protein
MDIKEVTMENKIIYGITGIFETPDEIINAAKKISESGYTRYDIHSPYPLHGMPKAMKLKPSPLGYFALVFGLTGAFAAFAMMTWMMGFDYPLIISGKSFIPIPAFIPVTFEVTVLLASVGTVLSMLFLLFKLPNNSHPLHDTDYMKQVSSNKFGVCIEAKDDLFDEQKVKDLLIQLGAKDIQVITYDNETLSFKVNIFEWKFVVFLIASALVVSAATYATLNKLMYVPPFDFMMEQHRIDAQAESKFFGKGAFSMLTPPDGTVPRNSNQFKFAGNPELADAKLLNPLLPTEENLRKGMQKYDIYCSPCHGYHGVGDARLNGQFPNPPSLHSEKIRSWGDGHIFYVITQGQNSMPSYSSQLTNEEKWQIVLYVRALQRAMNAKEEDMK